MVDKENGQSDIGLQAHELRTLVGLIRVMVGLDQRFDEDEAGSIATIARDVGDEAFWREMQESYSGELTYDQILDLAKSVESTSAQQTIYGNLYELAINGGITATEEGLLTRLTQIWSLDVEPITE